MSKLYDSIGQFTTIPNTVIKMIPRIGDEAFTLWCYLRYRTNSHSGVAFPAYDTIKTETGLNYRKIARSLRKLESLSLLSRSKRFGCSSEYTLTCPSPNNGDSTVLTGGIDQSLQGGKTIKTDSIKTNSIKIDIAPPKTGGESPLSGNGQTPRGAVAREILTRTEERVGFDELDREGQAPKGRTAEVARALASVCGQSIKLNRGKFMKAAKTLLSADKNVTADMIEKNYGAGGWYWDNDWRGLRGQKPTLTAINETWGQWNKQIAPDLSNPTPADKEKMKADYIKESKRILMGKGMSEAEAQREAEGYWKDWSAGRI